MGIRIKRISINRGGPLNHDFVFEPGKLNLIYGHNETGKTYIVEAMIDLLFETGRDTPWILKRTKSQEPTIRKWKPSGEIMVSGLEDETTLFTSGGKKLEDFSSSAGGLPEELSRLMVVRAGDTKLSATRDGVGNDILRTYLSGKGVLDEVENSISQITVKKAVIKNGIIEADQKGLIDDRLNAKSEMEHLEELQLKVDENASLGAVNALEMSRKGITGELRELEDARKYKAYGLNEELKKLEFEEEELPSEKDLSDIRTEISLLGARRKNLADINEKLEDAADIEDNYSWILKAGEEYLAHSDILSKMPLMNKICLMLLFLLIPVTVAGGFFSKPLMVIAAAGALICLLIRILNKIDSIPPVFESNRNKLEEEFRRRFQRKLTDIAVLRVEMQKLEKEHVHLENLKDNSAQAKRDIKEMEANIRSRLHALTGKEVADDLWDASIELIRNKRKKIRKDIISIGGFLSSLNVVADSYLFYPAAVEWDQKRYKQLGDELDNVLMDLEREKRNIDTLKTDISAATGLNSRDIKQLLTALEDKRETAENTYKDITARILAENRVYRAVCEFRDRENIRLEEALESPEVISPLFQITERYTGLKMDSNGFLILTTADGEEFPLEQLSTGAAEQVYIALRTAFAGRSMGETAFLLLDDAFQHSDWDRRKNLVNHVIGLVNNGWQVFYFTMDDHLKKLFDESARELIQPGYMSVTLD